MRKGLALVAMAAAACGDDGSMNNGTIDASVDSPAVIMPDAPSPLEGVWKDTYFTTNGSVPASACNSAPAAVKVDSTSAVQTTYSGNCKTDGTFKIEAPVILDTYYVKAGGVLYETDKRSSIDLGTDRLGRSGVASITGVTLGLNVNNMQPWTTGDVLVAFASNVGYRQNLSFNSGSPTASSTTISGVVGWNGYQIDSTKSDQLQIMQLGKHTTGAAVDYLTLDRAFYVPQFTMSNNTQHSLTGSFTSPDAKTLALSINVTSFNQFASIVAPTVTSKSVQGVAYAAVSTDVVESPPLFSFTQPADTAATVSFGTVGHGDPFPAAWKRMVRVQVSNLAEFTYNGKTGSLTAVVGRVMTKAAAEAATVDAKLGPVTNVKFDADNALTDTTISPVPVVSWSAPTLGTPTDYEIQVYEAVSSGATLSFSSVLRLVTKSTSVRIPDGYLLGQRQYVFVVRARIREGVDVSTTPVRAGTQSSVADTITALVTTDS
jgi:hypothetical protein